jgi:hypothetical protein
MVGQHGSTAHTGLIRSTLVAEYVGNRLQGFPTPGMTGSAVDADRLSDADDRLLWLISCLLVQSRDHF